MSYIPTPEKLQALGLDGPHERPVGQMWHESEKEAKPWLRKGIQLRRIILYSNGGIRLINSEYSGLTMTLPSEEFFDQLIAAIKWEDENDERD